MSLNQSRSEKSEPQFRKPGRSGISGLPRASSGGSGKGGGGSAPPTATSVSTNRSYVSHKKSNNHAHGGQPRGSSATVNVEAIAVNSPAVGTVQNGGHIQPPLHGASSAPVPGVAAKPTDSSSQRSTARPVPKAPSSQAPVINSDMKSLTTPAKDASKAFPLQFGTITPGFMNGMQIPARTSSAPPNLDEQKRDQACHDAFRAGPTLPVPTVPKQQLLPKRDAGPGDQSSNFVELQLPTNKAKREVQVPPVPVATQTQKSSVRPASGISTQTTFHQQRQVPLQFGAPTPPASLQMPMHVPLPMGNAPPMQHQQQQQVFVPGLQPHPILHQGQGLGFMGQMGGQMPPQLSNMGMGITPQFSQLQAGKYAGHRKTAAVKITDPTTHEELRLDKRADNVYTDGGPSGPRAHPNVPSQSQTIPSFAHMNIYPGSYNSLYYTSPSTVPLTSSTLMTPSMQPPRLNFPASQGPQSMTFINPPNQNPLSVNKSGPEHGRDVPPVTLSSASSASVQVTVKPAPSSIISPAVDKVESSELSKPSSESSVLMKGASKQPVIASSAVYVEGPPPNVTSSDAEDSTASVVTYAEGRRKQTLSRSDSIKDHQKNAAGKKDTPQPQIQVGGQSTSISSLACSDSVTSEALETPMTTVAPSAIGDCIVSKEMETPTATAVSSASCDAVIDASTSDTYEIQTDSVESSERSGSGDIGDTFDTGSNQNKQDDISPQDEQLKHETLGAEQKERELERLDIKLPEGEGPKLSCQISQGRVSSTNSLENARLSEQYSVLKQINDVGSSGNADKPLKESPIALLDSTNGEVIVSHGNEHPMVDAALSRSDSKESSFSKPSTSDQESSVAMSQHEGVGADSGGPVSHVVLGSKDKSLLEQSKGKSSTTTATASRKKNKKKILQKADAAGTTSDLYNAYKEEKKEELMVPSESSESTSIISSTQVPSDAIQGEEAIVVRSKVEPDDWEDAADISTPELETLDANRGKHGGLVYDDEDGDGVSTKKYSRDFLLTFSEQCTGLPEGLEISSDIAEAFNVINISRHFDRESPYPSPGRIVDRPTGQARLDRRGSGLMDDDKWSKLPGPFPSGRDVRLDIGYGGNLGNRPNQGGNFGVLRNPRNQSPVPYAGGILSGPMMQRTNSDADKWQRASGYQKGLIPSPQTPLQAMHKAERKYEVGKVTDEEQAKQRQLKAILNKLTPQNFEKLFEQVKAVNIDNVVTLTGVISQIFDKALMEPTFCEMYANFCCHLANELPDLSEDNEKITFKRLLLNKCQEEFERGEREQEEANRVEEEGQVKQSNEEREEKRIQARRRMLGNIRLIGELYKKKMLTERIMHECIKKLLGQCQTPDEEDVEALCKLMSTIGEIIDHPKAKEHMDVYFSRMANLSENKSLSSRVRFMLKDAIDLRKNKWQQRRKVEGPKKIEEVHRDAAQERQAQAGRLARGPSIGSSSGRRGPSTMDYGLRGSSMLSSPNATQMAGFRPLPTQARGFGGQDVRVDDRHSYDARTLSVPLSQRPMGDDNITLGPQGGLGRGMSVRGSNGYSSVPERAVYGSKEDLNVPRFVPERSVGQPAATYEQQERTMNYGHRNPDRRGFDRPMATSPPTHGPVLIQNAPSEKVWPEERLRDMSIAAIKEFYSAKDEKEIALCIKDLNAPSFYPSMISIWVTDSFERKDIERNLLAKLLVNLATSKDAILNRLQLVKGFESVLSTLEDAVNDAPKAAEFLGHLFAKVIVENVIPLRDIGKLIYEGGEEPGRLLEIGLAAEVLGSVLEMIKLEKGESVLSEIRMGSDLKFEDFRPPDPRKSRRLDKFMI